SVGAFAARAQDVEGEGPLEAARELALLRLALHDDREAFVDHALADRRVDRPDHARLLGRRRDAIADVVPAPRADAFEAPREHVTLVQIDEHRIALEPSVVSVSAEQL